MRPASFDSRRAAAGAVQGRLLVLAVVMLALAVPAAVAILANRQRSVSRGSRRYTPPATLVVVALEGFRPDKLRDFALRTQVMPHLRDLAKEGVWFERHYAASDGTNAALASLLTGLLPRHHGVGSLRFTGRERLSPAARTVAEELADAGFRTLASVALPQLDDRLAGFEQGFARWHAPGLEFAQPYLRSGLVFAAVRDEWIDDLRSEDPVFLFLHFADARPPRNVPPAMTVRAALPRLEGFRDGLPQLDAAMAQAKNDPEGALALIEDLLDRRRGHPAFEALELAREEAEYAFVDAILGDLVRTLREEDRYEEAVIVVVGNTGPTSKREPFDHQRLHVPLLVRYPKGVKARRVSSLTSAVDVAPTLFAAVGVETRSSGDFDDGQSLLPLLALEVQDHGIVREDRVVVDDAYQGRTAVIDQFWLVPDGDADPPLWIQDGRSADEMGVIAPLPGRELDASRQKLLDIGGTQRTTIALVTGRDADVRVDLAALEAKVMRLEPRADVTLDVTPEVFHLEPRPTIGFRLRAAEALGAEARLDLALDRRDASLEFGIRVIRGEGEATEDLVWIGDRTLDRLPLPRLIDPQAPPWPRDEVATLALDRESGPWHVLTVAGKAGELANVVVMLHPTDGDELECAAGENVRIERIEGRRDVVRLVGNAPFEARLKQRAHKQFALTARIGGMRVPAHEVRIGDRRMQRADDLRFLVPGWMPGIADSLSIDIAGRETSRQALPAGSLRILRTNTFRFLPEPALVDSSTLGFLTRLPAEE